MSEYIRHINEQVLTLIKFSTFEHSIDHFMSNAIIDNITELKNSHFVYSILINKNILKLLTNFLFLKDKFFFVKTEY